MAKRVCRLVATMKTTTTKKHTTEPEHKSKCCLAVVKRKDRVAVQKRPIKFRKAKVCVLKTMFKWLFTYTQNGHKNGAISTSYIHIHWMNSSSIPLHYSLSVCT